MVESLSAHRANLAKRICIILKATREDAEMTQGEVADAMGWTRNMVANVEHGRRALTFADFVMFAKVFNMKPDRLLNRILSW